MSAFDDLQRQLSQSVADRASAPAGAGSTANERTDAATDAATGRDRAPRPRRWWTTRPFALALVGLTVAGTATAATVALQSEPSDPLVSRLPAVENGRPQLFGADRYSVAFTPDLRIGHAGWCVSSTLSRGSRELIGADGCNGDAASRRDPVITVESSGLGAVERDDTDRWFFTAIVDERIAAVRVQDGRVLRPIADPSLPSGWKAVIATGPGALKTGATAETYFDDEGRPSAAVRDAERYNRTTQRPFLVPLPFGRTRPGAPAPWSLLSTAGDVRIGVSHEVRSAPKPTPDLSGRPFLVVSTARIALDGRQYQASYLVDARRPGTVPAALAGAVRDPGTGLLRLRQNRAQTPATARGEGRGWLVVRGPSATGRATVIEALRAGPRPGPGASRFPGLDGSR